MIKRAEAYPWSSAHVHCGRPVGKTTEELLCRGRPFPGGVADWSEWLAEGLDDEVAARIRKNTYTRRPCGDSGFVAKVERRLSRSLRPGKRGRKPRVK